MNLEKLTTSDLLNYSTILENIITTNIEIQGEAERAVSGGFCTKEEIEKIVYKSIDARTEADEIYAEVQKELDMRIKKDLGMKFGVRRSQSIIKEFDAFISAKNNAAEAENKKLAEDAKRISEENVSNLSIASDDNT
jgi:hypothetical protein